IIHIEDISRAFIAALRAPREVFHNQAFNVGISTENYQIRELAEIVQEIVPNCRIEYAPDAGPDKRSYRVDFSKIGQMLPEFKPQWNARLGAQELYDAFLRVELTSEDYEAPTFKRLDRIKELLDAGQLDMNLRWTEKVAV
ncbi:MAG TPA: NAD-dependent dehydratase, partial [Chloroflexota bacterium]|nr:NAD-dependent dehydratase [Chloroflexota bacterium]